MILHPGILALLTGSLVICLIMVYASGAAIPILRYWNIESSSEKQLSLERKTWLISALLNYAFIFQIISVFLFILTAEDIHPLFIGAMCATGSLNANLIGWLVLLLKIFLLFAGGFWVLLNLLDQNTEDTPLVKFKYRALLFITPFVGLDLYLQWRYFQGLQPEVITSCCGSLFSSQGDSVASDLVAMPVAHAVQLFATSGIMFLLCLGFCYLFKGVIWRHLLFVICLLTFFISLGSVVSFLSLYIYQMPSHHCPFDMLQGHYDYVGYPLYTGLFTAAVFGMAPGLFQPFCVYPSIKHEILRLEKVWIVLAGCGFLLFLIFPVWHILFGSFRLFGY